MTARKFSDEVERQIVERYRSGASMTDVAREFGCTDVSVGNILRRAGVPKRSREDRREQAALTESERADVIRLYEQGMIVRDLARRFRKRTDDITAVLDTAGVEVRSGRAKLSQDDEKRLVSEYQAGATTASLARKFDITKGTVTRILGRWNVVAPVGRPKGLQIPDDVCEQAIALYLSGLSQQKVAKQIGISQSTVSKALMAAHINKTQQIPAARGSRTRKRVLNDNGYVLVVPAEEDLQYVKITRYPYVLEHRLVMARHLGRPLQRGESVHHINAIRDDNRIENLQLRQGNHGSGAVYSCNDCSSHNVQPKPLA